MPEEKSSNHKGLTTGAISGLILALLARKLTAGDQDLDWKDYAKWGAGGAFAGGAVGHGIDVAKSLPNLSDMQVEELEDRVKTMQEEADKMDGSAGLLQAVDSSLAGLGIGEIIHRLGFAPAMKRAAEAMNNVSGDVVKRLNDDIASTANRLESIKPRAFSARIRDAYSDSRQTISRLINTPGIRSKGRLTKQLYADIIQNITDSNGLRGYLKHNLKALKAQRDAVKLAAISDMDLPMSTRTLARVGKGTRWLPLIGLLAGAASDLADIKSYATSGSWGTLYNDDREDYKGLIADLERNARALKG